MLSIGRKNKAENRSGFYPLMAIIVVKGGGLRHTTLVS